MISLEEIRNKIRAQRYPTVARLHYEREIPLPETLDQRGWHKFTHELQIAMYECAKINKYPGLSLGAGVLKVISTVASCTEDMQGERPPRWVISSGTRESSLVVQSVSRVLSSLSEQTCTQVETPLDTE